MLSDEELVDLVAHQYAGIEPDISLDSVERRGRRRHRNLRIGAGAAVVAVVMVVAGATAFVTTRTPKAPPADPVATACNGRYAEMSGGRSDRSLLPALLPAPIIDMHHGAAEFRLYATAANAEDKRFVFDCSRTAAGTISAHLTVAIGTDGPALGVGDSDEYYRDYLPDGSGALVGEVTSPTTSVTVRTAGGEAVPVAFAHGFFVAWSLTGDLDDAAVAFISADDPQEPAVATEPTILSGTFDPQAFAATCVANFTRPSTGSAPDYVGSLTPVLTLTHGTEVVWIYSGSSVELCDFESTATDRGFVVYSLYDGKKPEYGIRVFGKGLVAGEVPSTVTAVHIVTASGQVIDAATADGVFVAWTTAKVDDTKHTKVIATSPTTTYTIIGHTVTSTPR